MNQFIYSVTVRSDDLTLLEISEILGTVGSDGSREGQNGSPSTYWNLEAPSDGLSLKRCFTT